MSNPGWGIAANVLGTRVFRSGARVWVLQFTGDRALVSGHSRGGRVVRMWVPAKALENPRVKWVHDSDVAWAPEQSPESRASQEERVGWIKAAAEEERARQEFPPHWMAL